MAAAGQVHETRATMRLQGSTEPGRWRWVGDAEEEAVIATRQLLLPYTLALREKEANDAEWLLLQQEDALDVFPDSFDSGAWGVTYFHSYFHIFLHPTIQNSLRSLLANHNGGAGGLGEQIELHKRPPPKVVVLGSALGSACVWPTLAFGFKSIGFEMLPSCVEASRTYRLNIKYTIQ